MKRLLIVFLTVWLVVSLGIVPLLGRVEVSRADTGTDIDVWPTWIDFGSVEVGSTNANMIVVWPSV